MKYTPKFSTPEAAYEEVMRKLGAVKVAEACGIDRTSPYRWKRVPAIHVVALSELSGVPVYDMCPEVFTEPDRLRALVCPKERTRRRG